jgi:hypothetical protein
VSDEMDRMEDEEEAVNMNMHSECEAEKGTGKTLDRNGEAE